MFQRTNPINGNKRKGKYCNISKLTVAYLKIELNNWLFEVVLHISYLLQQKRSSEQSKYPNVSSC